MTEEEKNEYCYYRQFTFHGAGIVSISSVLSCVIFEDYKHFIIQFFIFTN
jgi:hypothetical protein